jgi:hypothetical protein
LYTSIVTCILPEELIVTNPVLAMWVFLNVFSIVVYMKVIIFNRKIDIDIYSCENFLAVEIIKRERVIMMMLSQEQVSNQNHHPLMMLK